MDGAPVDVSATEAVTALLTIFLESTNRRDATTLAAILAPDYLHHWPFGHETVGSAAYVANLQHVAEVFPDLTVTADQIFASDDFGAMVWTATGTQRQPLLGFPPSDHPASWTGLFLHRLAGSQIAETWTQADHLSRLQQQGSRTIHNQVRSWSVFSGETDGAIGEIDGQTIRVIETRMLPQQRGRPAASGTVLHQDEARLLVQCGDGPIEIVAWNPWEAHQA